MRRPAAKNQRLQERLHSLNREMSRVETTLQTLSTAVENPDREEALQKIRQQLSKRTGRPRSASDEESGNGRLVPREDLFEKASAAPNTTAEGPDEENMTDGGGVAPRSDPDQRFAQYFVTGGLQSVRPLRQERRVQRNKAIVMVVIAMIVLYGVFQLLF